MQSCENCRNSYNVENYMNYRGCKVVDRYKNPPLRMLGIEGKCPYYDSIVKEERNK